MIHRYARLVISRKVFFVFLTAFLSTLLNVHGVYAESYADIPPPILARIRIEKNLPGYSYYNVTLRGSEAFFFAFNPNDERIKFAWYRLDTKRASAKPKVLFSSSEFSLIFRVAFSPDGKTAVAASKTGEVIKINSQKNKVKLGVSTKRFSGLEVSTYAYPAFTPDGKYLLLHNSWENSLLVLDSKEKDLSKGKVIEEFWLKETGGGQLPEKGSTISVYEFFDNGGKVRFGGNQMLNLEKLEKEE